MPSLRKVASVIGFLLSVYAVYVEHKVEHKDESEDFHSLCDIDAIGASCSAVFALPVGRMVSYFGIIPVGHVLDVPNALLGALYYMILLTLPLPRSLLTPMVVLAFMSSVFLAYQLTFVLFELCVLCWTTHIINSYLLYEYVVKASPSKLKRT